MVERSLCMREVRESMLRISKTFLRIRQFSIVVADNGKELTTRYKSKTGFSWVLFKASSKLEEYGDVAQMVERSLCMGEVRRSMTRISKAFLRIRQFWFVFADNGNELTTRYKWKLIFHELCSEARSKRNHYGDVAQMVERSLCMREVRGSMLRISKTFLRIRQFSFVVADNGKELTTRYKSKTGFSWVWFKASSKLEEYGDVAQMVELSLSKREVRGAMPRIFETLLRIQ